MDTQDLNAIQADTTTQAEQPQALPTVAEPQPPALIDTDGGFATVGSALGSVKQKIVAKATEKINDQKLIDKHSEQIAQLSDEALTVETEKQRLIVEQAKADNKVVAQEIKNQLLILKAEGKRIKREQKQLDKEQKANHKKRNQDAKWEMYGEKLKKMGYSYVPNDFVLKMLLFIDGVKTFLDGIGTISMSLLKALRVFIFGGLIFGVLMAIPVTREWLLTLLQFK